MYACICTHSKCLKPVFFLVVEQNGIGRAYSCGSTDVIVKKFGHWRLFQVDMYIDPVIFGELFGPRDETSSTWPVNYQKPSAYLCGAGVRVDRVVAPSAGHGRVCT